MLNPDPHLFSALGDETRLALLAGLAGGPMSTTELARDLPLSRQAVRKHLDVLGRVGLVHDARVGRRRLWSVDPRPLQAIGQWADAYRRQWESRFVKLQHLLDQEDR
jgi:DNA-binding transcriptional ArsR family regulator